MRWPRVRFTMRGMMAVVAVVAIVVWGEKTRRKSAAYRGFAAKYAYMERYHLKCAEGLDAVAAKFRRDAAELKQEAQRAGEGGSPSEVLEDAGRDDESPAPLESQIEAIQATVDGASNQAEDHRKQAAHFSRLKRLYQRAADCPWLHADPGQPPPETFLIHTD